MEEENRQQQVQQLPSVLRCPRCWSMDTKFGYFNNSKTSQPRYFCKACRRYWTHGGKLRSIPYGGGAKKRRSSTGSSSSTSSHGEGAEILRVANSLPPAPPVIVGSRGVSTLHKANFLGDGFKLATQNPTRPQVTANNPFQLAFTQDSHLSQLWGFSNDLNPFIANLVGQDQGQSWSSLFDRLRHVNIPPNGATSLWAPSLISSTPASTVTTTNWNNSGSVIGGTSSSSSIDWFSNLPGYGPFP